MTKTAAKEVHKAVGEELVADQVASAAHDVIDRAAQQIGDAEARARAVAATSVQRLEEAQQEARAKLGDTASRVADFVRGRPVAAIGIVFVTGTLLGTMLRR
ncbi:MAG TPA: hypothetical protein VMJ74_01445 [Pseudomonadales bacterium]|nr:hypothetical protein [Pseudomonadales bacterium]